MISKIVIAFCAFIIYSSNSFSAASAHQEGEYICELPTYGRARVAQRPFIKELQEAIDAMETESQVWIPALAIEDAANDENPSPFSHEDPVVGSESRTITINGVLYHLTVNTKYTVQYPAYVAEMPMDDYLDQIVFNAPESTYKAYRVLEGEEHNPPSEEIL